MSKNLEQFVKDNREEFDNYEPGPVVWYNIQQQLKKPAPRQGILISMKSLKWSAAAAVIILVAAGAYFFGKNSGKGPELAGTHPNKTEQLTPKTNTDSPLLARENPSQQLPGTNENPQTQKDESAQASVDYDEEMYHYAKLVEIKQKQITQIKKDEPLLYQKFAGDINKLDSAFHTLKKQLPVNPNREQILEAMIENLRLQEAVLNQQLNIIKQIKQAKQSEYEKAYKSA